MRKLDFIVAKQNNVETIKYTLGTTDVYDERVSDKVTQLVNIIPFQYSEEDGQRSITSYVHEGTSLELLLKKVLNKKEVLCIMSGLAAALEIGTKGIPVSYLVKDLNYIYVDIDALAVKCILVPIKQDVMPLAEIPTLFRTVISKMKFNDEDTDNYVAKLLTLINSDDFSITKYKALVDEQLENIGLFISKDKGIVNMTDNKSVSAPDKDIKVNKLGVMNNMQKVMNPQGMVQGQIGQSAPQMGVPGQMMPMQPQMQPGQPMQQNQPMQSGQPAPQMGALRSMMPAQPQMHSGQPNHQMQQNQPMQLGQPAPQMGAPRPMMPTQPQMQPGQPNQPMQQNQPMQSGQPNQPMQQNQPMQSGHPAPQMGAPRPMMPTQPQMQPGQPNQPMQQSQQMQPAQPNQQTLQTESPMPQMKTEASKAVNVVNNIEENSNETETLFETDRLNVENKEPVMHGSLVGQLGTKPIPHIVRKKTGEAINITKPEFSIGKSHSKADYAIDNNTAISRVHCVIVQKDGVNYIKDNNSTNHTYVNGVELQPGKEMLLKNKMVIQLGDEEFTFLLRRGE